jgi:hypothetical protein
MTTKPEDTVKLTVEIPRDLHRAAKSCAALAGSSLQAMVVAGLRAELAKAQRKGTRS